MKSYQNGILCFIVAATVALLVPAAQLFSQQGGFGGTTGGGGGASARPASTNTASQANSSNSSANGTRQYHDATMMGDAIIQIDPETRSLVIVADEETHNEIMKVIKSLDQPKPQVLIKVVFAQVTLTKDLNVGVEGSYTFNMKNQGLLSSNSTTTTTSNGATGGTVQNTTTTNSISNMLSPGTPGTGSLQSLYGLAQLPTGSFARITNDNWQATLYALASKGDVTILSRPSIVARNNQQAVMMVGQEIPFVTNSQITDTGQTINTIQYQNIGIILTVTPFITSDRTVEMIVSPEISSLDSQSLTLSPGVSSPIIDKTAAETVVVTPDATTVVIGGMIQKQKSSNIQKVPLLGDIPLIGAAFRYTTLSHTNTELLIFLTPYIIEGTSKMKALTDDEIERTDLPSTAFKSKEDLNRYLDTIKLKPVPTPTPKPGYKNSKLNPDNMIKMDDN